MRSQAYNYIFSNMTKSLTYRTITERRRNDIQTLRNPTVSDFGLDDLNTVVFQIVIELHVTHSVVFLLRLVNCLLQPTVKSQNLNNTHKFTLSTVASGVLSVQ